MCNPISLIITEDKIFLPPDNTWNHSHSFIMKENNIPDGLIGDKYLRLEVIPPNNIFRNKETNERLEVNDDWEVFVDEKNVPDWYFNDKPNQEDRAREAAKKWFNNFPDNLIPGYKETAGDDAQILAGCYSTLTGGYNSTLTGGNYSTLTGGNYSTLTGGYNSTLTGGDCSTLTGGYRSTLTGGHYSTLTGGDGSRLTGGYYSTLTGGNDSILTGGNDSILTGGDRSTLTGGINSTFCAGEGSEFILHWYDGIKKRTTVAYVGENGIEPNKKYYGINSKFEEVKE